MSNELVTIANVPDAGAADIICAALDAEGIRAFAANGEIARMYWTLTTALGGVCVQVSEKDVERARQVLEESGHFPWHELDPELAEPEPEPSKRDATATRALRAAVFGILFLPLQFYGIWLLWNVTWLPGKLQPNSRRAVWLATLLLAPLMLTLALGPLWFFVNAFGKSPFRQPQPIESALGQTFDHHSFVVEDLRQFSAATLKVPLSKIRADSTFASLGATESSFRQILRKVESAYRLAISEADVNDAVGTSDLPATLKKLSLDQLAGIVLATLEATARRTLPPEDDSLRDAQVGRFADLSQLPNPRGYVLVHIPSVEALVARAEDVAGRPLTALEVDVIRQESAVIAVDPKVAEDLARQYGGGIGNVSK